jgi:chorismate synthase
LEDPFVLVQIPADLQAIKVADLALAAAWREHTRALFERVFDQGYTAVDLLFEAGKSCYLLEKDFTLDET